MDTVVFSDITIGVLLKYAALLVGIFVLARIVSMFFRGKKSSEHTQFVRCDCGWQGHISKFAGRCPKCNKPLGEQRASGKS